MATFTATAIDFMRPRRGRCRCMDAPEAPSQTFKVGTPLIFSVTAAKENQVKTAGADPTTGILGVSSQPASGVEGTIVTYWIAEPGVEFQARVQDTGVLDWTNVGTAYGLVYDATNTIWRVDLSDTSNVNVIVTALIDTDGDVNGYVAFQFKASSRLPFLG